MEYPIGDHGGATPQHRKKIKQGKNRSGKKIEKHLYATYTFVWLLYLYIFIFKADIDKTLSKFSTLNQPYLFTPFVTSPSIHPSTLPPLSTAPSCEKFWIRGCISLLLYYHRVRLLKNIFGKVIFFPICACELYYFLVQLPNAPSRCYNPQARWHFVAYNVLPRCHFELAFNILRMPKVIIRWKKKCFFTSSIFSSSHTYDEKCLF